MNSTSTFDFGELISVIQLEVDSGVIPVEAP